MGSLQIAISVLLTAILLANMCDNNVVALPLTTPPSPNGVVVPRNENRTINGGSCATTKARLATSTEQEFQDDPSIDGETSKSMAGADDAFFSSRSSCSSSSSSNPSAAIAPTFGSPEYLAIFVEMNAKHNRWFLAALFPSEVLSSIPHVIQTWMRNFISGTIIYFGVAGLWSIYIYVWHGDVFFADGSIPRNEDMLKQIRVSMVSMPVYSALPTLSEYMIEQGWTKSYHSIKEVGWPSYFVLLFLYFLVVEVSVYWVHRILHDVKFLYHYIHATHHIYNKQNTLSPFAGLAFNPFDGIAQASPYVAALFILPIHALTHELALFFSGVWATNIHDCIHGNVWPMMGAGYHTIHHTSYKHNYGHYTIWMDWMMGTLRDPKKREMPPSKNSGKQE